MNFKFGTPQDVALANRGHYISFKNINSNRVAKFKALLKTFEDSFQSEWESTTPYGRMDPIMNFKRTGRKISVSFDVIASNIEEAKYNLGNISLLTKMLYPSYEAGDGGASLIKDSPFFIVKMMNLISAPGGKSGLLCTLEGFTYSPNLEAGAYDETIGATRPRDIQGHRVFPKQVTVSVNLTILHRNSLNIRNLMVERNKFPYNYSQKETKELTSFSERQEVAENYSHRVGGVDFASVAAMVGPPAARGGPGALIPRGTKTARNVSPVGAATAGEEILSPNKPVPGAGAARSLAAGPVSTIAKKSQESDDISATGGVDIDVPLTTGEGSY